MSEYCEYCKRTTAALAAANARVAELEAALESAESLRVRVQEDNAMMQTAFERLDEKLKSSNCAMALIIAEERKQLTALREAVAGVLACADMPTADDKPEVIKNFHAFIAAIERLRREVGA